MPDQMVCPQCGGWIYLENDMNGSCDTCDTRMVAGQLVVDKLDSGDTRTVTLHRATKEKTINLLTPEELITALREDAAIHFMPRRCGKRFIISLYYHLNMLLILEKENRELRKKLDKLEQKEV